MSVGSDHREEPTSHDTPVQNDPSAGAQRRDFDTALIETSHMTAYTFKLPEAGSQALYDQQSLRAAAPALTRKAAHQENILSTSELTKAVSAVLTKHTRGHTAQHHYDHNITRSPIGASLSALHSGGILQTPTAASEALCSFRPCQSCHNGTCDTQEQQSVDLQAVSRFPVCTLGANMPFPAHAHLFIAPIQGSASSLPTDANIGNAGEEVFFFDPEILTGYKLDRPSRYEYWIPRYVVTRRKSLGTLKTSFVVSFSNCRS